MMKKTFFTLLFVVFAMIKLFGQGNTAYDLMLRTLYSKTVEVVMPADISSEKDVVYLDAREKKEFEVSHIKGAQWIGYDTFKAKNVEALPKDAKIVVYCSVGYRSEKIGEKLLELGFTDVLNLYGGVFQWKNDGYTVVDQNNNTTNKVHAYSRTWGIWLNKGEKVY